MSVLWGRRRLPPCICRNTSGCGSRLHRCGVCFSPPFWCRCSLPFRIGLAPFSFVPEWMVPPPRDAPHHGERHTMCPFFLSRVPEEMCLPSPSFFLFPCYDALWSSLVSFFSPLEPPPFFSVSLFFFYGAAFHALHGPFPSFTPVACPIFFITPRSALDPFPVTTVSTFVCRSAFLFTILVLVYPGTLFLFPPPPIFFFFFALLMVWVIPLPSSLDQ